jgi:RNA methyltransferase, TrmH family
MPVIPVRKLAKLSPTHRMRKAALVLGDVERQLLARTEGSDDEALSPWASQLAALFTEEGEAPESVRSAAAALRMATETGPSEADHPAETGLIRAIDALRHALFAATGQAPADWDLIDPRTGLPDSGSRRVFSGTKAYLDDIRSPFNVGSIFRTADAFGLEELVLSPGCADPRHPRAQRSAMGAVDLLEWRRSSLESISKEIPIFALELGGDELNRFAFPRRGIVILGSEELGISREAREFCSSGTVSIPMSGAKGSLNVAVAFGILMYAWNRAIEKESGNSSAEK